MTRPRQPGGRAGEEWRLAGADGLAGAVPGPRGGERWATRLVCSRTGETAPLDAPAFLSPAGAPWLVDYRLDRERGEAFRPALAGPPWTLGRYRELLPLAGFDAPVDLGDGATPPARLPPAPPARAPPLVHAAAS